MAAAHDDNSRLLSANLEAFKQKPGRLLALKVKEIYKNEMIAGHGVNSFVTVEICNLF